MDLEQQRAAATQQWNTDAKVREEFGTLSVWLAYSSAVARGLVKVARHGFVTLTAAQARAELVSATGGRPQQRAVLLREGNTEFVRMSAPLALAAADGGALPSRFSGVAYSGGYVPDFGAVIDLASTTYNDKLPLLNSHYRNDIVGVIEQAASQAGAMTVAGRLFSDMAGSAAERIAQLAQRGAPFELSVGLYSYSEELIDAGQTVEVNGQTFTGPLRVMRRGQVREVSVVTLGADPHTSTVFH